MNIQQQTLTAATTCTLYLNKYISCPVYSMSESRSDSVHGTDARNKLNQQNMFCSNQDLCHALWNLLHGWLELYFPTLSKQPPFLTSLNCYQSCSHQLTICSCCWCCCSCNVSWAMVLSRLLSSTLSTCTSLISSSIWKRTQTRCTARAPAWLKCFQKEIHKNVPVMRWHRLSPQESLVRSLCPQAANKHTSTWAGRNGYTPSKQDQCQLP